ncbi:hypothetical protein [Bacillus sp. RK1064]|uniref:hypothetical protein n=1 Tax=Bacillus sp. RK1064 TaxID=3447561 RepID=UPI003EDB00BE
MNRLIRYVFKHKNTGKIETKRCYLSQLETNPTEALAPFGNDSNYDLISRDLCFDEEKGVFVGDLIEVAYGDISYTAVVKLGEYDQDGSAGEYEPRECVGFYAEALNPDARDKKDRRIVADYHEQRSLNDVDSYKIIGTVYENIEQREESE